MLIESFWTVQDRNIVLKDPIRLESSKKQKSKRVKKHFFKSVVEEAKVTIRTRPDSQRFWVLRYDCLSQTHLVHFGAKRCKILITLV